METVSLSDSILCRLCAQENKNGTDLFASEEEQEDLSTVLNKYLPLRIEDDGKFPKKVCPGCFIQFEATKIFFDLIIEGQAKLRELYRKQEDTLVRQEKQRLQLEEALHNVNPNSSIETYTIQSDETGEKFFIQIYADGPLFPPEHEMLLKSEGLDKPKRKRGRPPKPATTVTVPEEEVEVEKVEEEEIIDGDGRKRRKIKAPSRYSGVVEGKELDKILKEEGVLDDLDADIPLRKENSVIGRIEDQNGEDLGELVVLNKRKSRNKNLVKKRTKFQCKTCHKEFLSANKLELHILEHSAPAQEDLSIVESANEIIPMVDLDSEPKVEEKDYNDKINVDQVEKDDEQVFVEFFNESETEPDAQIETEIQQVDNQFKCLKCEKLFSTKQNAQVHIKAIHDKEKKFSCHICSKKFSYKNCLKVHMESHSRFDNGSGKKYPCGMCDKVFLHPSSLLYHKQAEHDNGKRFVCVKCNKRFKHRQLLQRHQLVHSDERPYKCTVCSASFKTKANLLNHQTIHTGERNFCCNECGHTFTHKTSLKLHQRWHLGQKPYKCDVCDKAFSQKGNLAEHKRIHTGEKPYCCDHCGRSFTTSSQFKLHKKRHTGERPWRCHFCLKSFLHKDSWKSHTRRHLNDRPFKCKQCPRAFAEALALRKHERLHTGEKPYQCEKCDRSFADSSNLAKHRKTHETQLNHFKPAFLIMENIEKDLTNENDLDVKQLVDQQGNPISLTTQDGRQVRVVTGPGNDGIQGLLPDGTFVPIDLTAQDRDVFQEDEEEDVDILNSGIQFLSSSEEPKEPKLDPNIQFLTGDGQEMCLVTTYTFD